jgi:hypothetical protein
MVDCEINESSIGLETKPDSKNVIVLKKVNIPVRVVKIKVEACKIGSNPGSCRQPVDKGIILSFLGKIVASPEEECIVEPVLSAKLVLVV